MPHLFRRTSLSVLMLTICAVAASSGRLDAEQSAGAIEPIRYTVSFPEPHTHYLEIEATVPTEGRASIELMLAVWTPGSYLVREYARHIEALTARAPDGGALSVEKSRKNRWRVDTGGADTVLVSYRLYCREMSVRTNWVEADFAMLNGAPTFLTLVDSPPRPHDVQLQLPDAWNRSMSAMPPAPGGAANSYRAADFDTLVDSPIVAGNPAVYEFTVDGKPHALVNIGEGGIWDGPQSAKDVEAIVRANLALWGSLPYERYVFLNMITESGGGLEHKASTLMMTSRWRTRTRSDYRRWLGLVSHEYFHAWNIKRLRPVELGPFDYENEVHTTGLWMGEGVTSYYGDVIVARAGLVNRDEFLAAMSNTIRQLQTTPGRLVQPVETASYDAWIKGYRPDENSPNTSISYYTKGQVIGLLVDARIRTVTAGARSLDDVMRLAYERYAGERGFTADELVATASEVAGQDLSDWMGRMLRTTDELEYDELLAWYGLRFRAPPSQASNGGAWLGLVTRTTNGRLLVAQVRRETPGYDAGINVGDEILAIDGYRVPPDGLAGRLARYEPGARVELLVSRRERLTRLEATLGEPPGNRWSLEIDPDATAEQTARLEAWIP